MAKSSTVFVCRECGGESIRWGGQCPHCRAWNTLEEFKTPRPSRERGRIARLGAAQAPVPITEVQVSAVQRLVLGWDEVNRVLGGGVVPGSVVLVGGEPGVGKSTLLMHVAAQAATGGRVLYTTGEESAQQVGMRGRRLGLATPGLLVLPETDVDTVADTIEKEAPTIAIVDSIQTMHDPGVEAAPGSVSQVREAAARLIRTAKASGVPVFLVGHVTKEGAIAGPRVLEHMVDTVLYLEGERGQDFRILRAAKNRFGSTEEIGIFTMGDAGMAEVLDPSLVLLGDLRPVPGTVVLAAMEGNRPLLVELQSLVATAQYTGNPRRAANGVDLNRVHMLLAVLDKRAHVRLGSFDIFVNVAGGMKVIEPAADLGLALSLVGNAFKQAIRPDTVVVGEVGLSGEVRRVSRMERRLQEASRRGFVRAVVARGAVRSPDGMQLVEVADLSEAIKTLFPAGYGGDLELPRDS